MLHEDYGRKSFVEKKMMGVSLTELVAKTNDWRLTTSRKVTDSDSEFSVGRECESVAVMSSCGHELAARRQKAGNEMSRIGYYEDPLPGNNW
jgi:hypothetical protein